MKLTTEQVLVFDWIAGSCQVNLSNFVYRIITFPSIQVFFAALW